MIAVKKFYSQRSIRTCVCCRGKILQKDLIRFRYQTNLLELYNGAGRSFYICHECLENKHRAFKSIKRIVKNGLERDFEEIVQTCNKANSL